MTVTTAVLTLTLDRRRPRLKRHRRADAGVRDGVKRERNGAVRRASHRVVVLRPETRRRARAQRRERGGERVERAGRGGDVLRGPKLAIRPEAEERRDGREHGVADRVGVGGHRRERRRRVRERRVGVAARFFAQRLDGPNRGEDVEPGRRALGVG